MLKFTLKATGLAVALSTLLSAASCDQPRILCLSARGEFAAVFKVVEGSVTGTPTPGSSGPGDCLSRMSALTGDVVGFQTYNAQKITPSTGEPNGDWRKAKLGIGSQLLGELLDHAHDILNVDNSAPIRAAVGDFTAEEPDANDQCHVTTLSPVQVTLPEVPAQPDDPKTEKNESLPLQAATTLSYKWSNVTLLVSPQFQGTQFRADLEFSRDGCTAQYKVQGLYPGVDCSDNGINDCENPANGISPDIVDKTKAAKNYACQQIRGGEGAAIGGPLQRCVLTKDFPVLN